MKVLSSSCEFHKTLESPVAFLRRESRVIAFFGAAFALVFLAGILTVDPAYFYPRLGTDTLLYHLKGLAFAETWHTNARSAINRPPFPFVAMPGVLRSPFIMAFKDFDNQLRAIQISNIAIVGITATLYAYILSWIVPRKWHWLVIGFAFAFMLASPDWAGNVFQLLADAPFAFFSIVCMIISTRVITSTRPLKTEWLAISAAVICFAIAFQCRYTALAILVYVACIAAGRRGDNRLSRRSIIVGTAVAIGLAGILIALNWDTIHNRYIVDNSRFPQFASKASMVKNLLVLALPSQIIPNLQLFFVEYPLVDQYHISFGSSPRDVLLVVLGLAISGVTLIGMWQSRRRFAPEIAYTLAALPLLTVIIPGTSRYLMAYQPFFWISFYTGASALAAPFEIELRKLRRVALASLILLIVAGTGLVLARRWKAAHIVAGSGASAQGYTRSHAREIASTFRALRVFLETLPRDRALLIGGSGTSGRWTVISKLDYFRPDTTLRTAVASRDVYLVAECGTYALCRDFDKWDSEFRSRVDEFGPFNYQPVFSRLTDNAKARVYQLHNP
ncbi:MAG TPA: hypothetical protein VM099_05070 [Gemmatimonadaceae bacterium]|nr:hypothetical protein [Gemmatimonadaceae bacterium]